MTTLIDGAALPAEVLDALEELMVGAIGMTSVALANAAAGGLTMSQWRALVVIGRADQVRVGGVATAAGMSLPSTSRLIRRLERGGLVASNRDEEDRRATLVTLTPAGRRLRDDVVRRRRVLREEALIARGTRLPDDLNGGLAAIARAFEPFI
jgi:DNA-binding MarR family transcriptional regulator